MLEILNISWEWREFSKSDAIFRKISRVDPIGPWQLKLIKKLSGLWGHFPTSDALMAVALEVFAIFFFYFYLSIYLFSFLVILFLYGGCIMIRIKIFFWGEGESCHYRVTAPPFTQKKLLVIDFSPRRIIPLLRFKVKLFWKLWNCLVMERHMSLLK